MPTVLADNSLTGQKGALALSWVIAERGAQASITVDNSTEFASKAMDVWAYQYGVQLDFIRPGRADGEWLHFQRRAAGRMPEGRGLLRAR